MDRFLDICSNQLQIYLFQETFLDDFLQCACPGNAFFTLQSLAKINPFIIILRHCFITATMQRSTAYLFSLIDSFACSFSP